MRIRVQRIVIAVIVASGCRSPATDVSPALETRIGTYQFSQRIPGKTSPETITFEGRFTILGDTVILDASPGPCQYDRRASSRAAIVYQCGDVGVTFDRANPIEKAMYAVDVVIVDTPAACTATLRASRRGCPAAENKSDRVERRVGRLNAKVVR